MERKAVSGIVLTLVLTMSMLTLTLNIQKAKSLEPPATEWTGTYGGINYDSASSVVQTSDGGYVLAGWTNSSGAGDADMWLVKVDSSGNHQWNKTYGRTSDEWANSVVKTSDGGYALAGWTRSFGVGDADFWLVKTNSSGNEQWNKTYGGINDDMAYSVVATGDGYALAGTTNSSGAGGADFWLVKTNSSGNEQWNKTYGGINTDRAYSIVQTGDGGYVLAGWTNSSGAGDADMWLVKVDSSGNHQWNETYGGAYRDQAWSVVKTSDGGYALAGTTNSSGAGQDDMWLVKVDSSGNHLWNKTYGGANSDRAYSLVQKCDGGYAIAGETRSFVVGESDFWLVKTDSFGNQRWNKTFGGANADVAYSVVTTGDCGYALAGYTESFGAGGADMWLVKVAGIHDVAVISVVPCCTVVLQGCSMSISVTVENQGECPEIFNVTLYANTIVIGKLINVALTCGNSKLLNFGWDTSGFAGGYYQIKAYASPVPHETDTDDNWCVDGTVQIVPSLRIHIYGSEDQVCQSLEACTVDINDWPLTKEWIDKWVTNPAIQLRSYTEMGMTEFDINNRKWPTGCPYHSDENFQTCARCRAAREFRKAIAYLTNKEKYLSEYLKGYGYRLDYPIPPFQSPYLPDWYSAANPPYPYDPTMAATVLYNAGFRDYDSDGTLEWKNVYGINDPGGNTGTTYEELPKVKFWVDSEDQFKKDAGQDLANETIAQKIPLELHVVKKDTCYKNVMIVYDYNIYTGGWSLSTTPDTYYDLYSRYTYYYPNGWSLNYPGFCNSTFDYWATKVKYPQNEAEAIAAAKQCGDIVTQSVPCIWLCSRAAVKAYKTGWTGVVNAARYGIDNYCTFLMMDDVTNAPIDWGFKTNIESLNVLTSGLVPSSSVPDFNMLWSSKTLGLIYESMLGSNPFARKSDFHYIANDTLNGGVNPEVTIWDNAGEDATELIFAIRTSGTGSCPRPTFHNETDGTTSEPRNRYVTAEDVEFSIDYNIICGPSVSGFWTSVKDVHSTWVDGSGFLHVRMNSKSYWAADWIGRIPIINPDIWNNIPDTSGGDTCNWQPGATLVYNHNWDPWAARLFDPATEDINGNGIVDLKEDGTGQWIFDSYIPSTSVCFIIDPSYYLSEAYLAGKIGNAFHYGYGDVDESARVDSVDLGSIERALLKAGNPNAPPPAKPWQWGFYNSWADLDKSGIVNTIDATTCAQNYGAIIG